jgi:hypothetical protein
MGNSPAFAAIYKTSSKFAARFGLDIRMAAADNASGWYSERVSAAGASWSAA